MAIEEFRGENHIQENGARQHASEPPRQTGMLMLIFLILAGLVVTNIYTFRQMKKLRDSLAVAETRSRTEITEQFSAKLAAVENSNAQALNSLKTELDQTAERMGSTGKELKHARAMVSKLQTQQEDAANKLKSELTQEIAQKADVQQVGALTEDISAAKTDLDQTKKLVNDTRSDLGMTRSEFGTLIARNHDDVEQLRKMGDRDYFEFTLARNKQQAVAGVGLMLKKTNVKRHQFNVNLLADDMVIEKKDRTVNEPILFSTGNSKKFYELVINQVQSNQVTGYISTPKGAVAVAAERSEGGR